MKKNVITCFRKENTVQIQTENEIKTGSIIESVSLYKEGMDLQCISLEQQLKNIEICCLYHNRSYGKSEKKIIDYLNMENSINKYGIKFEYEYVCRNTWKGNNKNRIQEALFLFQQANKDIVEPLDNAIQYHLLIFICCFPVIFFDNKRWKIYNKNKTKCEFKKPQRKNKQFAIKLIVQIIMQIYQESYMIYYQYRETLKIEKKRTIEDFKNDLHISDKYLQDYECDFIYETNYSKYRTNEQFLDDNKERILNLVNIIDVDYGNDFNKMIKKIENFICEYRAKIHSYYDYSAMAADEEMDYINTNLIIEQSKEDILKAFDELESNQKYLIANYFPIYETLITEPIYITKKKTNPIYLYEILWNYTNLLSKEEQIILLEYMDDLKKYKNIKSLKDDERLKKNFYEYEKLQKLNIEEVEFDGSLLKEQFQKRYLNDNFAWEYSDKENFEMFKSIITIDKNDWDFLLTFLKCYTRNSVLKEIQKLSSN